MPRTFQTEERTQMDNEQIKKIRRRIEDRLRKARPETVLEIAKALDVPTDPAPDQPRKEANGNG